MRYLLAIERVETRKTQLRLSKDQLQQLKERRQTEEGAAEGAIRNLYAEVWLPKMEAGAPELEKVDRRGRTLQATTVHEQMTELLTSLGRKWVHTSVTPQKVVERVTLGDAAGNGGGPRLGITTAEVVEAFFCFLDPPRIDKASALQKAIAKGVADGVFGYTSGCEGVLDFRGNLWIHLAANDAVLLELAQLLCQRAVRHPNKCPVKLTKAACSLQQLANEQCLPPAAHKLKRSLNVAADCLLGHACPVSAK